MTTTAAKLPGAFITRRLHSLFGFWIVLFLVEHLITNSQAALLLGDNGEGFIRAVNFIKNLPYLHVIEVVLIGVPILYHAIWGISYAIKSRSTSYPGTGNKPRLTKYSRNWAYTLQRLSSWVLLVGILLHVGYMRFYRYPTIVDNGKIESFFVRVGFDTGLYTLSERLGVTIYDKAKIAQEKEAFLQEVAKYKEILSTAKHIEEDHFEEETSFSDSDANILETAQKIELKRKWIDALEARSLGKDQVIAEANNFGTVMLLVVRDSFKSVFKCILYTIFVLAACFHGFNGLWTFLITWGAIIRAKSQSKAVKVCVFFMLLLVFLGLSSVWGTYFFNLKS